MAAALERERQEQRGHASCLPHKVYFLSAAFFSAGGTMMWAYGVPFHITHGHHQGGVAS